MAIRFFDEDVTYKWRNKRLLATWLRVVAKREGFGIHNLNVVLKTDRQLLDLNRRFLQHDYFTDVITFDYSASENTVDGEVYISIDRVAENASAVKESVKKELNRVIVHGLLHLMGYKDKSAGQREGMRAKEDFYLSLQAK